METSWYNRPASDVFTSDGRSLPGSKAGRHNFVELRCPQCDSSDLRKVSLAYQEGLWQVDTRIRLIGLAFGSGGPSVLIGKAAAKGAQQTELSKRLRPPMKWSCGKVVLWFALVLLAFLIGYVHVVMASTHLVSSVPGEMFGLALLGLMIAGPAIVWRHNHFVYQRALERWDRSFVCGRCGAVSEHKIDV